MAHAEPRQHTSHGNKRHTLVGKEPGAPGPPFETPIAIALPEDWITSRDVALLLLEKQNAGLGPACWLRDGFIAKPLRRDLNSPG